MRLPGALLLCPLISPHHASSVSSKLPYMEQLTKPILLLGFVKWHAWVCGDFTHFSYEKGQKYLPLDSSCSLNILVMYKFDMLSYCNYVITTLKPGTSAMGRRPIEVVRRWPVSLIKSYVTHRTLVPF